MVAACSASVPIMKPGSSMNETIGRWEGVAELDEAPQLLGAVGGHAAAVHHRIVRHHAHRVAVDPGEARDLGAPVARGELEERPAVHDGLEDAPHLVGAATLPRHPGQELLLGTVAGVFAGATGRTFPDVRREVGQERADLPENVFFVAGDVVDDPVASLDLRAAQVFLRRRFPDRLSDESRASDEDLGRVLRHDREVGCDEPACGIAGHRPQRRRDHRHARPRLEERQVRRGTLDEVVARAPLRPGDPRDRGTTGLEEPNARNAQLRGQAIRVLRLLHPGG